MKTPNLIGRACVLCLGAAMASNAANYYVSTQGNDGNPGTISAPWKTLLKVSTARLVEGDSVLLERGGVWRETLTLPKSGTATAPIVVAPYGAGTVRPEIRGTASLSGEKVDGIRSSTVPGNAKVKTVAVGNTPIAVSRYPESGWIQAAVIVDDTTVTLEGAAASIDWTGASIHMRTSMWTLETHPIKRSANGRVVLGSKLTSRPSGKQQVFFTNHLAGMSATRATWYQSSSDNLLRWSDPADTLATVEAAIRERAIDLGSRAYIHLRGLRVYGATRQGLYSSGTGVQVLDIGFRLPGLVGAQLDGARSRIASSFFVGAGNTAIVTNGFGAVIEANNIRQTAILDQFGPDGMGDGCCGGNGISAYGDSSFIRTNDIDLSGYNGINFAGRNTSVRENLIVRSCMTTDDCGGIYTWAGKYESSRGSGSSVRRNVIKESMGSGAGWPEHYPAARGIYLDDGIHDVLVDSNIMVANAASGLFLHNTLRVTARNNFIADNRSSQIQILHDANAGAGNMVDNHLARNTIVALPSQEIIRTDLLQTQTMPPATWADNILCSDTRAQVTCKKDDNPFWSQRRISDTTSILGLETQKKTISGNWGVYPSTASLHQDPQANTETSAPIMKLYDPTKQGSTIWGVQFSVSAGSYWLVSFRAKGHKIGQLINPVIRRAYGDYAGLGIAINTQLDTAWTEFSYLTKCDIADQKARIDFHSKDSVYWIEGISVRSIPNSVVENLPGAQVYVNPTTKPTIGYLQGTWFDTEGKGISALTIGAFSGRVVFQMEKRSQTAQILEHTPTKRIVRKAGGIMIEGAQHPVAIRDIRGTLRARIVPDAEGNAFWAGASGNGPLWAVVDGKTLALPVMVR